MIYLYFIVLLTCLLLRKQKFVPVSVWLFLIISILLLASSMRNGYDTENFIDTFETLTRSKDFYSESYLISSSIGYLSVIRVASFLGITNFFGSSDK